MGTGNARAVGLDFCMMRNMTGLKLDRAGENIRLVKEGFLFFLVTFYVGIGLLHINYTCVQLSTAFP